MDSPPSIPLRALYEIAKDDSRRPVDLNATAGESTDPSRKNDFEEAKNVYGPALFAAIREAAKEFGVTPLLVELAVFATESHERVFYSLYASVSSDLLEAYKAELVKNLLPDATFKRGPIVRNPIFFKYHAYKVTEQLQTTAYENDWSVAPVCDFDAHLGEASVTSDHKPEVNFDAFARAVFARISRSASQVFASTHVSLIAIPFPRAKHSGDNLLTAGMGGVIFLLASDCDSTTSGLMTERLFRELLVSVCLDVSPSKSSTETPGETIQKMLWSSENQEWFKSDGEIPMHDPWKDASERCLQSRKQVWELLSSICRVLHGSTIKPPRSWGSETQGVTEKKVYEAVKNLVGASAACQFPNDPQIGGKRPTLSALAVLAILILGPDSECVSEALGKTITSPTLIDDRFPVSRTTIVALVNQLIDICLILRLPGKHPERAEVVTICQKGEHLLIHLKNLPADKLLQKFIDRNACEADYKTEGNLAKAILKFQRLGTCLGELDMANGNNARCFDLSPFKIARGRRVMCSIDPLEIFGKPEDCLLCITAH